jgi:hypothetical protein
MNVMKVPVPVRASQGCRRSATVALTLAVMALTGAHLMKAQEAKVRVKPEKPAWQWTLDERLAQRFDPEARRARVAAKIAEETAYRKKSEAAGSAPLEGAGGFVEGNRGKDVDVINGRKNPELFLPLELFTYLIQDAFPPEGVDPSEYRHMIEERAVVLGFGKDLWARLAKIAALVLTLERQREELARKNPAAVRMKSGAEMDDSDLALCRARAEALARAEVEFGKESFLRLLYQATINSTEVVYDLYEGMEEHQRYLEEGCK